ncbi:MAG: hypothetical protein JAZ02_20210 [Candidatus Thiodiazotropha endolucinida]|nr:hypothetical protein [Candidatus Thiodiazotropha endolucinida]
MKRVFAVSTLATIFVAGCASHEPMTVGEMENAKQEAIEIRNEALEENIDSLPQWVSDTPKPDAEGMYAVGIGESDNVSLALKKARLEAEFGLAKLYSQELSGSERIYSTDSDHAVENRYVGLIDKLVQSVPVVGYSTVEQEIKAGNGKYQAYVLLKLPYDEFNKILKQQKEGKVSQDMASAFGELEKRLDMRRSQSEATTN